MLVVGRPSAAAAADSGRPALDALRRLVEAGAKPRAAASVVSELTGVPANALYKALTSDLNASSPVDAIGGRARAR